MVGTGGTGYNPYPSCWITEDTGRKRNVLTNECFEPRTTERRKMAMLEIEKARGFTLPDGAHLEVEAFAGEVNVYPGDGRIWKSLDISLVRDTGYQNLLCSIDYEDGKGLRVLAYEKSRDRPIFEKYIGYSSEATDGDESEDIPLFWKEKTMKIELSQDQMCLLLEALDALSENADNENATTDDKDIHESNDEKIRAVAELYEYIANHPNGGAKNE